MQKNYIYGLHSGSPKEYFYCGRTISMPRRLREHNYEKKNGTEAKYQFIRALESCKIEWEMELLSIVTSEDEHFEDWWVYKLICDGHPLQNQKMGDAIDAAKHDAMRNLREKRAIYNTAPEFLSALAREIEEQKARKKAEKLRNKVRRKYVDDSSTTLSAITFEKPGDRISPGLQQLLNKRKNNVKTR